MLEEIGHLLIICFAGIIAGSFGTLVGSGGLINVATLIILGFNAHVAIGTNRLGSIGVFLAGWYKFHKIGAINYKIAFAIAAPFLLGSIIGANIMLRIDEATLRKAVGIFTVTILGIVMIKRNVGIQNKSSEVGKIKYLSGILLSFVTGTYAGFFGPGFGTFLTYILTLVFGQTFIESAGTWKVGALIFSVITCAIYARNGLVMYVEGITLFIGTFIGSYIGAHYAQRIGNLWIKRVFFTAVVVMSLKLMF